MPTATKQNLLIGGLTLGALALMVATFFAPIWWVSLTAPNYPPDAFPDGIRIHFHFNGVFNGCKTPPKTSRIAKETAEEELGWKGEPEEHKTPAAAMALDCLHEMNTINHYVGMHPIEVGAPVERLLSKFLFGFFAVMMLGFVVTAPRLRLAVLGAGFAAVAAWMIVDLYVLGHFKTYLAHYMEEAGKFFREPDRIRAWGERLQMATAATVAGILVAVTAVLIAVAKLRRAVLLLALLPAALPLFFVIDYSIWLWFFGHNLHPWGAFTVKPFMPTVLGDGKVAQFTTHSYPHYGFFMLLAVAALLLVAALLRWRELRAMERPIPSAADRIVAKARGAQSRE